jgi:hypothetical protein
MCHVRDIKKSPLLIRERKEEAKKKKKKGHCRVKYKKRKNSFFNPFFIFPR